MRWEAWVLVAIIGLNLLLLPASIGRPRGPLEAPTATIVIVVNAFMIFLIARLGVT